MYKDACFVASLDVVPYVTLLY